MMRRPAPIKSRNARFNVVLLHDGGECYMILPSLYPVENLRIVTLCDVAHKICMGSALSEYVSSAEELCLVQDFSALVEEDVDGAALLLWKSLGGEKMDCIMGIVVAIQLSFASLVKKEGGKVIGLRDGNELYITIFIHPSSTRSCSI